jgi:enoyl-CoA hydratase/carnithine racemase
VRTNDLDISVDGAVARVTFQRPDKRNAITAEMWEGMVSGLAEAARGDGVRALVVEGASGSFSAGADLESVRGADGQRSAAYQATALAGLAAIREFPHPTLAMIDGPCIGGGCSIALACDVRFATPSSTFAVPAARYGFSYDEYSLRRLVELVGSGQACRFLFSAMKIPGPEAARIGLVDLCCDELEAEAESYLSAVTSGEIRTMAGMRAAIRRFAGLDDR